MALFFDRRAEAMDESIFIIMRNSTASVMSAGYGVCYQLLNITSANGFDVEKPATSALPAYTGIVSKKSIGTQAFGLVQVYGFNQEAFVRFESTDGVIPQGTVLGPINGQWYLQSNGRSYEFSPAVLMSAHAANTFEGQTQIFLRTL